MKPDEAGRNAQRQINVNTASPDELAHAPDIGAARARRIVEYRDANGVKFKRIDELSDVPGFGALITDRMYASLTVSSPHGQK